MMFKKYTTAIEDNTQEIIFYLRKRKYHQESFEALCDLALKVS